MGITSFKICDSLPFQQVSSSPEFGKVDRHQPLAQIKDLILRLPVAILQTESRVVKLKHWKLLSKTLSLCTTVSCETCIPCYQLCLPIHTTVCVERKHCVLPIATYPPPTVAPSTSSSQVQMGKVLNQQPFSKEGQIPM